MGCTSCGTQKNGMPTGCGDKGHCASGGCNKMNTYDWLTVLDLDDPQEVKLAEVSFKNGSRKTFYKIPDLQRFTTGDLVVVDTGYGGYDVGRISLMGDLVKLQMRKKNFQENRISFDILRRANQRDIERMEESRALEHTFLVKARVIARNLKLDMKIGDVEVQADLKKSTFYYTADGRVDFRELVRSYAKEFKTKNPYIINSDNALSEPERTFLKGILFEIQKYALALNSNDINKINPQSLDSLMSNEKVAKAIKSGEYFKMPLIRREEFSRNKEFLKGGLHGF